MCLRFQQQNKVRSYNDYGPRFSKTLDTPPRHCIRYISRVKNEKGLWTYISHMHIAPFHSQSTISFRLFHTISSHRGVNKIYNGHSKNIS